VKSEIDESSQPSAHLAPLRIPADFGHPVRSFRTPESTLGFGYPLIVTCDVSSHRHVSRHRRHPAEALGLVVPGRIEGQLSQESPLPVEHPDVLVGDQKGHRLAFEPASHADVEELGLVADGQGAGVVDLVATNPVVAA
jgi:hypothetical protein